MTKSASDGASTSTVIFRFTSSGVRQASNGSCSIAWHYTLKRKCITSRLAVVANLPEILEPLFFDFAMLRLDRPHDDAQLTCWNFRPVVGKKTVTFTGNPNRCGILMRSALRHMDMNRLQWVALIRPEIDEMRSSLKT